MQFKDYGVENQLIRFPVVLLALIMLVPVSVIASQPIQTSQENQVQATYSNNYVLMPVHASMLAPSILNSSNAGSYNGDMNVMITFNFTNSTVLKGLLSNLSDRNSAQYHKYLTLNRFDREFGQPSSFYDSAVSYFNSLGNVTIHKFRDHLSIDLIATGSYISTLFHTNVLSYISSDKSYYSISSNPLLPLWIATRVAGVVGLSNYSKPSVSPGISSLGNGLTGTGPSTYGGYPLPVQLGKVQFIWASDLQKAYNEQRLLNVTFPTNQSIATILWSGRDSNKVPVGPFYAKDIYTYYNDTLPPWEPNPKVYAVPLNGAPKPSITASFDVTDATFENTLDLEMAGSMAPGSSIYNVYSESNSYSSLDQAFSYILNNIANISVISNSWYSGSYNDSSWYSSLQMSQALGVTVLAASGDSGDNVTSSKYAGAGAAYPGTLAFNHFGMLSVGGATLKLSNTQTKSDFLTIVNQTAWYSPNDPTANNTAIGTQGGIDTNISEPVWQVNSIANNILQGQGRGVPDIGAIANNTAIYITINGNSYYSFSYYAWGTSIACPVEAGIIAELNAYLEANGGSALGYVNPVLYKMANLQYGAPGVKIKIGTNSFLNPFYDILHGGNYRYSEIAGYSLVTGLGTINAFNLSQDILNNFTALRIYTINITINLQSNQQISGIHFNGVLLPWKDSKITIFLTNGSYSYNLTVTYGKSSAYQTGNFNVTGSHKSVVINLNDLHVLTGKLPSNHELLLIIFLVLIGLIVIISVAMREKKEKR